MMVAEQSKIPILLDTDLGICNDDCLALFMALSSPRIELEAISICAGNFSMKQSVFNALSILEYLQQTEIPVLPGADLPLNHVYGEYERRAFGTWGEVGQAIWPFGTAAKLKARQERAWEWMAGRLRESSKQVSLVAIGPLTNVALTLQYLPCPPGLKEIIIMGGAIDWLPDGQGNSTQEAEFNFWVDPEAAQQVLDSGHPIRLIPINIWRKLWLDIEGFYAVARQPTLTARLLATVLGEQYVKDPNFAVSLGDALGIGVLLWPELCHFEKLNVKVLTEPNYHYGKLLTQPTTESTSWIDVLLDADIPEILRRCLRELGSESS